MTDPTDISWSGYESGTDLETLIQGAIDGFSSDRRGYWTREGNADYLSLVDTIAKQMVSASADLTQPEKSDSLPFEWTQYRFLAELPGLQDVVFEGIQISVAWELCTRSDSKAKRCLQLAKEVVADAPGREVLKFIRRLSRCYVAGFLPECVILCRGVVENAVKDKFRRHGIPLPATSEGESSMRTVLAAAQRLAWLSPQAHKDAWIIWRRGSKAVHEDLDATRDAWGTIKLTVSVLQELYGRAVS